MTVYHWVCPGCGERVYSPDIEQVGMIRRFGEEKVTQKDVDDQYSEYDEAVKNHICNINKED